MLFVIPTASELSRIVSMNAELSEDWSAFKHWAEGCEFQVDIYHFAEIKKFVIQINAVRGADLVTFINSELLEDCAHSANMAFRKFDLWHFDM